MKTSISPDEFFEQQAKADGPVATCLLVLNGCCKKSKCCKKYKRAKRCKKCPKG